MPQTAVSRSPKWPGHSRSSECHGSTEHMWMVWFPTLFHSCIVCYAAIGRKSLNLYILPVFDAPVGCDRVEVSQRYFSTEKTKLVGYHMLTEVRWCVKPLGYISGVWRTDKRTDRRTSISHTHTTLFTFWKGSTIIRKKWKWKLN